MVQDDIASSTEGLVLEQLLQLHASLSRCGPPERGEGCQQRQTGRL